MNVNLLDAGGFTPSAKKPSSKPAAAAIDVPSADMDDLDSDFSDIEEVDATTNQRTAGSTLRASGVVGNIAANIESQLLVCSYAWCLINLSTKT